MGKSKILSSKKKNSKQKYFSQIVKIRNEIAENKFYFLTNKTKNISRSKILKCAILDNQEYLFEMFIKEKKIFKEKLKNQFRII